MVKTRNFGKEDRESATRSTRDAVETAIDLSKEGAQHTWESLARRVKGRFLPWGSKPKARRAV